MNEEPKLLQFDLPTGKGFSEEWEIKITPLGRLVCGIYWTIFVKESNKWLQGCKTIANDEDAFTNPMLNVFCLTIK